MKTGIEILRELGACDGPGEAIPWALAYQGRPAEEAWYACERVDWLLWLAGRIGVDRRLVVLAACDCVRPVLHLVPEDEARPRLAVEAAEAWTRGEATLDDVRSAANAARAAYAAAYAAARAAYAAYAAAHYAAYAASYAANTAYYAANAAYYAAKASDAASARAASLRNYAELVRARIPWELVREKAWPEAKR